MGSEDLSLERYLEEIATHPVLTPEEELGLTSRVRKGDQEALDQLVRLHMRLVVSVARKYQPRNVPLSDLIDAGRAGLVRAAQRFNGSDGRRFDAFALWSIRRAVLEAVELSNVIPLHGVRHAGPPLESAAEFMEKVLALLDDDEARVVRLYFGFDAEPLLVSEIAEVMGITDGDVRDIKDRAWRRLRRLASRPPDIA